MLIVQNGYRALRQRAAGWNLPSSTRTHPAAFFLLKENIMTETATEIALQAMHELKEVTECLQETHDRLVDYARMTATTSGKLSEAGLESDASFRLAESVSSQVCADAVAIPLKEARERLERLRARRAFLDLTATLEEAGQAQPEPAKAPSRKARKTAGRRH